MKRALLATMIAILLPAALLAAPLESTHRSAEPERLQPGPLWREPPALKLHPFELRSTDPRFHRVHRETPCVRWEPETTGSPTSSATALVGIPCLPDPGRAPAHGTGRDGSPGG